MTVPIVEPLDVVRRLYPFNYSVVSTSNDDAVAEFQTYLDFDVHEFPSGQEVNGWVVPHDWSVCEAKIRSRGEVIYDAALTPLGVGAYSPSFSGTLLRDELREHLYFSSEVPTAIPYHWTNLYRPASRDWAICVPKQFFDELPDDEFDVQLRVQEQPGSMKVLDYVLPGETDATVLVNAHNCHPFQANDDMSGCAVAIAAFLHLQTWRRRRFTYRLVIAPELIGTVHWLDAVSRASSKFSGAVLLKSVGNPAPLKLQRSFLGTTQLDLAAAAALDSRVAEPIVGGFRRIYGNDETVFDSPGYEIPSISFTRFPFIGYHTDADTPETLSGESLDEAVEIVLEVFESLERSQYLRFSERGLVSLSHPRYDLYRAAPAPGLDRGAYDESEHRWNLLMNCLPRELDGTNSSIDLAHKYGLPVLEVCEYLDRWQSRGLARADN